MNRTPLLLAIVLLLLPMLYVGSYLALVVPEGRLVFDSAKVTGTTGEIHSKGVHYRRAAERFSAIFWPLEQIDRKVRPVAWEGVLIPKGQRSPFVPERTINNRPRPDNP